jgi:hypothetical protein
VARWGVLEPRPIDVAVLASDEGEQHQPLPLVAMSALPSFGILPVALPALVMGLVVAEGAAILSSRDTCLRFLKGLASFDVGEVSSVYRPVGPSEVESLHKDMFGTGGDVSLRCLSADFRAVFGVHALHVISVDEGSQGAKRLDETTTEVRCRLTSAGWRVERFSPLTGGRWEEHPAG